MEREGYKTYITDLQLSKAPRKNGCCNDDVIQLGPLHSQSLFQFVQISAIDPTHCNQLDSNVGNLEATVEVQ